MNSIEPFCSNSDAQIIIAGRRKSLFGWKQILNSYSTIRQTT